MDTTAGVMLLAVAAIAILGGAGIIWAFRASPRSVSRGGRQKAGARSRPARLDAAAAGPPSPPQDARSEIERQRSQTHEERIEAMRALLHRGDEKARRQATKGVPQFADTMPMEDDEEVSPPTLPLGWRPGDPEPGSARKSSRSGPDSGHNSGHIPL